MSVQGRWVLELRPTLRDLPEPACRPETWRRGVAELGEGPVDWAVELALDISERAVDARPEFGVGDQATLTIRPAAEAIILAALLAVLSGDDQGLELPPEFEQQMVGAIHRRVPLDQVMSGIGERNGQLAEALLSACSRLAPREHQAQQMAAVSQILFKFVNTFLTAVSNFYLAEERRWLASVTGARDKIILTVLVGEEISPDVATRVLAYDLANSWHVGFVFRRSPTAFADGSPLRDAAQSMLRSAGVTAELLMDVDRTEVWAWVHSRGPRSVDSSRIACDADVLATVGRRSFGVEGFRSTHADAQAAARVVTLNAPASMDGQVVAFQDVRLAALLTANAADAMGFMQEELGALCEGGDQMKALRETVRVYLECSCRPQEAARRLFVAKNTVIYRVKRVEELIGRDVKTRQLELHAALLLAATIGPDAGSRSLSGHSEARQAQPGTA